jgi:hypothetical protein
VSIGCTAPYVEMIGGPADGARLEAPILSVLVDGALLHVAAGVYLVDAHSRKAHWTLMPLELAEDGPPWW